MAKKKAKKKRRKFEDIVLLVGLINGIVNTICIIYETFFK